ncbi:MAG: MMPL family transporter [Fimbriimonadaceae bacterium]|nr:MMPL family transporter [Alphaproteobacteria bacterium]
MIDSNAYRRAGFGLERLGILCANRPRLSAVILIVLFVLGVVGVSKVEQDDQVSNLFRSERFEFEKFQNVRDLFRESENDVGIILEAPDMLTRDKLVAARDIYFDIFLEDGVASVFSLFTMREPPDAEGNYPPIFPDEFPEGAEYDKLRAIIEAHPLIMGRTVSTDRKNILIVAALDSEPGKSLNELVTRLERVVEETAKPAGIKVYMAGVPVLRNHVKTALDRDRVVFNVIGFGFGVIICLLFMRSFRYAAIASLPPVFALVFSVGLMGWTGLAMNALSNVLPALVMVLAFADSLHMVFAVREGLAEGMSGPEAAKYSVRRVGPACVLTSMTTAIALAAITFTSSELITSFGWIAAMGAVIAFVAVISTIPTFTALFLNPTPKGVAPPSAPLVNGLSAMCVGLTHTISKRPLAFIIGGLLLLAIGLWSGSQLHPRYQISAYLPDNPALLDGTHKMDDHFGGAVDILAVVRWKGNDQAALLNAVSAIRDVHNAIESHPLITNTWSVEALRLWLTDNAQSGGIGLLADFIAALPTHWLDRLLAPAGNAALVAGRVPDLESADIRQLADDLERMTREAVEKYDGVTVDITGISTLSARESAPMIRQLAFSVLSAMIVVVFLIALSFRSFRAARLSIIPNLIPISIGFALLYMLNRGLTYEATIALTLAFGIAVDDTIHFLYHVGRDGWDTVVDEGRIEETMSHIGPILILTTLVLGVGFAVTQFSTLPSIRGFGEISIAVLFFALVADLLVLPAIILWIRKRTRAA